MDNSVRNQMPGCEKEPHVPTKWRVVGSVFSMWACASLLSPGSRSAAVAASRWRSCCLFLSLSCWFSSGCWQATGYSWMVRQHTVTLCVCVWEENVNTSSGLPITTCFLWGGVMLLLILWSCFLQHLPWVSVWPWSRLCGCLVSRCHACCCQASSSMMSSG